MGYKRSPHAPQLQRKGEAKTDTPCSRHFINTVRDARVAQPNRSQTEGHGAEGEPPPQRLTPPTPVPGGGRPTPPTGALPQKPTHLRPDKRRANGEARPLGTLLDTEQGTKTLARAPSERPRPRPNGESSPDDIAIEPDRQTKRKSTSPHRQGNIKHMRVGAGAPARNKKHGRSAPPSREKNTGIDRHRPRVEPPKGVSPPNHQRVPLRRTTKWCPSAESGGRHHRGHPPSRTRSGREGPTRRHTDGLPQVGPAGEAALPLRWAPLEASRPLRAPR